MEKRILPVDGFLRSEVNPGAIINTHTKALQAYKMQREIERRKNNEINTLRNEVSDLKSIVSQLLEKLK
jgi:hypothetical protein